MTQFGGQYRSPAASHLHRADTATTLAAAGGRDEYAVGRKRPKKSSTGTRSERLVTVVIDRDRHVPSGNQLPPGKHQEANQRHDREREHPDAEQY